MSVRPAKTDQPRHPPSRIRVYTVRMKKHWHLNYPLSAQRRLWSDWADAQADLSLRWVHSHFVGFVMRRLILFQQVLYDLYVGWSFNSWTNAITWKLVKVKQNAQTVLIQDYFVTCVQNWKKCKFKYVTFRTVWPQFWHVVIGLTL